MTKKNRKEKNTIGADQESVEIESKDVNQASVGKEADASDSGTADSASDDISMDDLLDDVRKSLMEEAEQEETRSTKSSWWSTRGKSSPKPEPEPVVDPIPAAPVEKPDDYVGQIDQLIDMLDDDASVEVAPQEATLALPETVVEQVQEPQPQPRVGMDELKKRAFARGGVPQDDLSEVRSIALDGAEDVFVEVEAAPVNVRQDQIKSFENALRPYRQYIYFAVAFLAFVMIALVAMTMYTVYQRSRPAEVAPTFDPNLPYPTSLVMPGGLNFNLGRGVTTADGSWNPRGPEWLQGTEICRWVAIPWSTQLEAVVRTLTREDTIELVMNNGDRLSYAVNSIQELTLEEMQALDQNSPCLLLVLAEQNADSRWVVTALP